MPGRKLGSFGGGVLYALPIRPSVFGSALIHYADKDNGDSGTNGSEYHRPAGQGAGVLIPDTQDGQDEAAGQPHEQQ